MDAPRYGTPNMEYFASFFSRDDPGGPMWALKLMKYRARADYADGRETTLTGQEASIRLGWRWSSVIIRATADELAARVAVTDDPTSYAVIVDPTVDCLADTLAEPDRVRL